MEFECLVCHTVWDEPDPEHPAPCPRCGRTPAFTELDFLFAGMCRPAHCIDCRGDDGTSMWGEYCGSQANGFGIMIDPEEGRFEGFFKNGKKHGMGRYTLPPIDGERDGQWHEGRYVNGQRCGFGVYHGENGMNVRGIWADCEVVDKGEIAFPDGRTYRGGIKADLDDINFPHMHGMGVMNFPDGSCYEGDFDENEISGIGILRFPDGASYQGGFRKGLPDGAGVYMNAQGDTYLGVFRGGQCSNSCRCEYQNGDVYDGEWLENERHGVGRLSYADGAVYKGEFRHGLRHGSGTMKYSSGDVYKGSWENDLFCGKGIYLYANGAVYEGTFLDGERSGEGTYTDENGKTASGIWKNGILTG